MLECGGGARKIIYVVKGGPAKKFAPLYLMNGPLWSCYLFFFINLILVFI